MKRVIDVKPYINSYSSRQKWCCKREWSSPCSVHGSPCPLLPWPFLPCRPQIWHDLQAVQCLPPSYTALATETHKVEDYVRHHKMICQSNVASVLAQRRRRWASTEATFGCGMHSDSNHTAGCLNSAQGRGRPQIEGGEQIYVSWRN